MALPPISGTDRCECGIDPWDRCAECDGCDCPDNPGTCTGPGCISRGEYEQRADEVGWERTL